jgi:multiphosphoryl transfer protein
VISLVIVSHSARLAEGVCELAGQVAQGRVALAAAGGTGNSEHPLGTDAFRVQAAIESVYSDDGVVVLMDLGSAVLSAETALEFLSEERRAHVHLCPAAVVEGAVVVASLAAAGAGIEQILREAAAVGRKGEAPAVAAVSGAGIEERVVGVVNTLGLHARPAARFVRMARQFRSQITVENIGSGAAAVAAGSINGMLGLGARQGHRLRLQAAGTDAGEAVAALAGFVASGCGEAAEGAPGEPEAAEPGGQAPAVAGVPTGRSRGAEGGEELEGLGRGERVRCGRVPQELAGIAASAGVAVGPVLTLQASEAPVARRSVENPEAEIARLDSAIHGAAEETRSLYDWARESAGADEAAIFDAQALFLEDPALGGSARAMIGEERVSADFAWQAAAGALADRLRALNDPYLRARAADVADVAARVLRRLTGYAAPAVRHAAPAIIVVHDLTPSDVRTLDPAFVAGVCLEGGSANAHSVILVRAMGIPAVVGLGPALGAVADGTIVGLDGGIGRVWVEPDPERMRELEERRAEWQEARLAALAERGRPAATRDGVRMRLLANLSRVDEAPSAVNAGAEGVGVLRTEFLFLNRATAPNEDEQFAAYLTVAAALGRERPLVVRTLDIGGDKPLPYIEVGEEANPFLGWRGMRLTLGRRDLLRTQLRAILRVADAGYAVEVLFPMVSTLDELRQAKAALAEAGAELERERKPGVGAISGADQLGTCAPAAGGRFSIPVGVMIEVPAAVAVADQLAAGVTAFSIGTNDLIQYVMAADRTNPRVAALADPFDPAVLRVLKQTIDAGRRAGIDVVLCGELAADPLATPLLLGLGLTEFSVSAALIPELKKAIGRWSIAEANAVAEKAMGLDSSGAVRALLEASRPI